MPPGKSAALNAESLNQLGSWLQSILAYRPATEGKPWVFYEKIDAYLGPWGDKGYPLSYGLKYCKLFYSDRVLNESPVGKRWVRRTLLLLQTEIADVIQNRFRAGTLARLGMEEFTELAFDSHPRAYTRGGLSLVGLLAPHLLGQILFIPKSEFSPVSQNFLGTVVQVVGTIRLIVPDVIGVALAGTVGEAMSGNLKRAFLRDSDRFRDEHRMAISLVEIKQLVRSGSVDHVGTLQALRKALTVGMVPGDRIGALAADALSEVKEREVVVRTRYLRECIADPDLTSIYTAFDPDAWKSRQ
ncbi:MAG: hypothetical protein KA712_02670 [Myxococcales bacterium]|nr:hypothetical protein [Myxococcales bacterium]